MSVSNKLWVPAVFFSCIVGACSSGSDSPLSDITDAGEATTAGQIDDIELPGGDNTDGGNTVDGAEAIAILQGEWQSDCLPDDDTGIYMINSLSVSGANFIAELATFSDPECMVPLAVGVLVPGFTSQFPGVTVPTGESVITSLGPAVEVNFVFGQVTIDNQPIPEELAEFTVQEGEIFFDIALVDGDMLFLGDTNIVGFDGDTAETRPATLDFEGPFFRVP